MNRHSLKEIWKIEACDIIVTHHIPTHQSVSMKHKGHDLNCFYVTPVLDDPYYRCPAKYWIHGHSHEGVSHMVEDTRVLCNPYGYPFEDHNQCDLGLTISV